MSELLCKAKQFLVEKVANVKTPEATVTDVDLEGVHRDSIDYGAKVSVDNPYEAAIPICEISYVLKSDGRSVISIVSLHGPNRFILSLKKYCNLVLFFNWQFKLLRNSWYIFFILDYFLSKMSAILFKDRSCERSVQNYWIA